MKLIASDDAEGNYDGGADCDGSCEQWQCPTMGPHDLSGHDGHSGCAERGANGPNKLCSVIFSDGPTVFEGYDEIVKERGFEAKGANGPSDPFVPS